MVGAAVVVVLVAGGVGLLHSPAFKVRDVVVRGNFHTSRSEVVAAAGLGEGRGDTLMLDAGSPTARRAVEALPWVGAVWFRRDWPWTVVVTVKERVPAAIVEAPGAPSLGGTADKAPSALGTPSGRAKWDEVDVSGRVLGATDRTGAALALPVVAGVRGAQPGERVLPVSARSRAKIGELLEAASLAPAALGARGLVLGYSPGLGLVAHVGTADAVVLLGDPTLMRQKLAVLEELAKTVELNEYSEVDLTVPDRPALTPVPNSNND